MSNTAIDDDADAVLSDVEEDHPVPIAVDGPLQHQISPDEFRDLRAELDRERAAREAAESSKSELQVSFNRLKSLAHEAIKKRDECSRQRDDAIREKEEAVRANERLSSELIEANRLKEEIAKQREEIAKQFDELVKERDGLKSEMENSRHMLVSGIEKISGKVSHYKNFGVGGLPKSNKYTGFPAVAYGVIKRTNEIVEETVKQIDVASKSRNEAREQMEQRNYEIAIEVSQLEATISGLRDEVSKKGSIIENLEKKVSEIESEATEKVNLAEKEVSEMKELVGEYDDKLSSLESKIEIQRGLLLEQLNLVARIHDRLYDITKVVDATHSDSELSESLFLPQGTDVEENARASLAGMESLYELSGLVLKKTRGLVEEKGREVKDLNENVDRLVKEKEQIGSLLRSALSKTTFDTSSKTNELFQAAENGLREVGIDFKFSKVLEDAKVPVANDNNGNADAGEDEIYTLAGALESIVKTSQLEIIELQHSVEELRAESNSLKVNIEAQANELSIRMLRIEELEEKLRVANESIEGLMTDIAAAEEEINRWKSAAEQEAAAGRAVEQEFEAQLSALKQELEEARQAMLESEKKLRFKEETATAAMTAREAAEKSLRLADTRASRLREKVEELSRQIEELETRQNSGGHNRPRYVCWPWQWLGMDFVGFQRAETQQQQGSNEMELSEPLL